MTHCIKTGAWVKVEEYGWSAPCDIYAVWPDTLVLKFNNNISEVRWFDAPPRYITHIAHLGLESHHWWREDVGVLVISAKQLVKVDRPHLTISPEEDVSDV